MDRQAFYRQLDEILELDSGTITGTTMLKGQEGWNSMAVISLIAMVDDHYALALPPKSIAECATAEDLAKLMEQHQAEAAAR
jgi:acyl carrier protein